jgi:hypothetical protein
MKADYRQRDLILKAYFTDKDYIGGSRKFNDLPLELLELLVLEDHTPHDEKHNEAPTIRDMLILAKQLKSKGYDFYFGGYAISPKREDYRVSVDTIIIKSLFDNDNHINNRAIKNFFKDADEVIEDTNYFRFWYD